MGSADQGMLKQTFWNICERMVWAARCNRSELLLSLREVRKACLQNIPEESSAQSIIPVPSNLITSNTNSNLGYDDKLFEISIDGMMVEKIVNTSTDVHKIKISEMVDSNIKINDYFTPSLYEILKSKIN